MSEGAIRWARQGCTDPDAPRLTRTERFLLGVLATYHSDVAPAQWPTLDELVDQMGCAPRRILDALYTMSPKGVFTHPFLDGALTVLGGAPQQAPTKKKVGAKLRRSVLERDGYRCLFCGSTTRLTMDHVIPEAKGGPTTFENLQVLCGSCNSRKGVRVS